MSKFKKLVSFTLTSGILISCCFASAQAEQSEFQNLQNGFNFYLSSNSVAIQENIGIYYKSNYPVNFKITVIDKNYYRQPKVVKEVSGQQSQNQLTCPLDSESRMIECAWQENLQLSTDGLQPGLYLIEGSSSGEKAYALLTIRTPKLKGLSVYKTSTLTQAAYNAWGGYSLYHGVDNQLNSRAYKVSLDRPLDSQSQQFIFEYEIPMAVAAVSAIPSLAWTSDLDIHRGTSSLKGVKQLITSGHDEYWTYAERNAVENVVKQGTNLFVAGANSMYWRVRTEASPNGLDRRIISYKSAELDPVKGQVDTTSMWRQEPKMQPESFLLGTQYNDWFWHCKATSTDWVVADKNWWGFKGTGVKNGSRFAGVVGREVDQVPTDHYGIPRSTQIVAHVANSCSDETGTYALAHDATYVSKLLGGSSFAVGTQTWTCALNPTCTSSTIPENSKNFVTKVTRNVLVQFNKGKVSGALRSKNNVVKFYRGKRVKYIN